MKPFIKNIILFTVAGIIAILIIASLVVSITKMGANVFQFSKNLVEDLGGGNMIVGIIMAILTCFGLANSVIGFFKPPQFLASFPTWVQYTYLALSLFGTAALFYVFINRVL